MLDELVAWTKLDDLRRELRAARGGRWVVVQGPSSLWEEALHHRAVAEPPQATARRILGQWLRARRLELSDPRAVLSVEK